MLLGQLPRLSIRLYHLLHEGVELAVDGLDLPVHQAHARRRRRCDVGAGGLHCASGDGECWPARDGQDLTSVSLRIRWLPRTRQIRFSVRPVAAAGVGANASRSRNHSAPTSSLRSRACGK